jgi:hypothetical protein
MLQALKNRVRHLELQNAKVEKAIQRDIKEK